MITLFNRSRGAPRLLVAGLGNPGDKYLRTRHNLGFRVIDRLLEETGAGESFSSDRRHRALIARVSFSGQPAVLVKPQTFVNRSGQAVGGVSAFYRIPPSRVLVVCDDMALPFGEMRLRNRGSSGGHNGLQSIIAAIGSEYARLRIGIGAPGDSRAWSGYVLAPFSAREEEALPGVIERALEEIKTFTDSLSRDALPGNNG